MMNSDCGTAILYFSLSPKVQAQKKRWRGVNDVLAGKTQAKLFHHTADIIKKSGIPFIHFDENNQRGNDFGSKLSNAIEDMFSLGYLSLIVLGNDCPQLNTSILESAKQQLKANQAVLGPSQSGVYLIGFQKDKFDKTTFQNLPWQSNDLQTSLLEYFKKFSSEPAVLPFLADLNRYQELSFFVGVKNIDKNLFLVFQALIQCLRHLSYRDTPLLPTFLTSSSISHRGPPAEC